MYFEGGTKTCEIRYNGINLSATFSWPTGRWNLIHPSVNIQFISYTGGYKSYFDIMGDEYHVNEYEYVTFKHERRPEIHENTITIPDFRIYYKKCIEEQTANGTIYKLGKQESDPCPISIDISEYRRIQ